MVLHDPVETIDLSEFAARKPQITMELMAAASDIGFFRVKGLRMHILQQLLHCIAFAFERFLRMQCTAILTVCVMQVMA